MAVPPTGSRSRHWQFTLNNPTEHLAWPWVDLVYGIYQLEIAPDTGTEHFQGYVYFSKDKRLSTVKALIPRAHLEVCRGTPAENRAYCSKEESRAPGTAPVEYGEFTLVPTSKGARSDITSALEYLQTAQSTGNFDEVDFALQHTTVWAKYPNFVAKALNLSKRSPYRTGGWRGELLPSVAASVLAYQASLPVIGNGDRPDRDQFGGGILADGGLPVLIRRRRPIPLCYVEVHFGPPGTGKSSALSESYPYAYRRSPGKWWDGYSGETTVVLDDFDGSWFTCTELLRILDSYAYRAEVKGCTVDLQALHFCISSNLHPDDWYPEHFKKVPAHKVAIHRRINLVVEYLATGEIISHDGASYFSPVPRLAQVANHSVAI